MVQRKDFNEFNNPAGVEILGQIKQRLDIRIAVESDADLAKIVEARLPLRAITALVEHGLQGAYAFRKDAKAPSMAAQRGPSVARAPSPCRDGRCSAGRRAVSPICMTRRFPGFPTGQTAAMGERPC